MRFVSYAYTRVVGRQSISWCTYYCARTRGAVVAGQQGCAEHWIAFNLIELFRLSWTFFWLFRLNLTIVLMKKRSAWIAGIKLSNILFAQFSTEHWHGAFPGFVSLFAQISWQSTNCRVTFAKNSQLRPALRKQRERNELVAVLQTKYTAVVCFITVKHIILYPLRRGAQSRNSFWL